MSSISPYVYLLALGASFVGCGTRSFDNGQGSSAIRCTDDTQCAAGKETCDVQKSTCAKIPPGIELGTGDGSAASVTFTVVHADAKADFVDLAFNADTPSQLWAISYKDDHVHIGSNIGPGNGTWRDMKDPASPHFMHLPPAIAWGSNGFWATCGDNDNAQNDPRGANIPNYFMGPALFPSDLNVFTKQNLATGLGSHYDMLHSTSFCRGIAHVTDNWFWVFNGQLGSLDKYNFAKPHGPGEDDHSDGEIYRYAEGQVKAGASGTPSHVAYDPDDQFLYVADTGNKRIVRLDTNAGTLGERLPKNEVLAKSGVMNGAQVEVVVPPGVLDTPVGLEVRNNSVYVTDTATGRFYVFDKTGKEIRRLETGLPANALAGFTFGSDNKLWFVDRSQGRILRIDPK